MSSWLVNALRSRKARKIVVAVLVAIAAALSDAAAPDKHKPK